MSYEVDLDTHIRWFDNKIISYTYKKEKALKLKENFNILKNDYKNLKIVESSNGNYHFIADLEDCNNKKSFIIFKRFYFSTFYYYFKLKDKKTNLYIYDISYDKIPYSDESINYELIEFNEREKIFNIKKDYLEILKTNKQAIKKIQDFIISKSLMIKEVKNETNNHKIQQFIDNLIFI